MTTRRTFTYKGCTIAPRNLDDSILVACNQNVNRYLKTVWLVTFPDRSWTQTGTKRIAQSYVDSKGNAHGVASDVGESTFPIPAW